VRNTRLATRLASNHRAKGRRGSWLDDPNNELDQRAREDIATARRRFRSKRKTPSDGQTIAELSCGFWRFLLANRYGTTLWPNLAGGFPHAPDRARTTVEGPIGRLHDFRNRLAHHEPVWNKELATRRQDIYDVLSYIDPLLQTWVARRCRIPTVLLACPVIRPHP
jgi:hypothetical protein